MADITYQNFDLLIEREAEGYRAKVNSPEGEAANDFRMPFSDQELADFLERVSQPWRSTRAIDSPELQAIKDFGGRLFTAVFDKSVYTCFSNSLATASRLRIRLRLKDVPELAYPALGVSLRSSCWELSFPVLRYAYRALHGDAQTYSGAGG